MEMNGSTTSRLFFRVTEWVSCRVCRIAIREDRVLIHFSPHAGKEAAKKASKSFGLLPKN